jgi:hypothetical protein
LRGSFPLLQIVAVVGAESHAVDALELLDFLEGLRRKRCLAFKSVENDSFEQIAEGHVFEFGDSFQDFEEFFLQAHSSLDTLDLNEFVCVCHVYQCTKVKIYRQSGEVFALNFGERGNASKGVPIIGQRDVIQVLVIESAYN